MSRRTNSAVWQEAYSRWRVAVQKDGQRRYFYSSTPGRTGQREANRKADAWLEDGIGVKVGRVEDVYKIWLEGLKQTTSASNYEPIESRWRTWVLPIIGKKRVNALTDADLQAIVNKAAAAGKSRKTLQSIAGDLRAFCKFCRKAKLSTYLPEDVQIPASARLKGKKVLQPDDLIKLFSIDTTLYRNKRVHDDYINAYRFAVLTYRLAARGTAGPALGRYQRQHRQHLPCHQRKRAGDARKERKCLPVIRPAGRCKSCPRSSEGYHRPL